MTARVVLGSNGGAAIVVPLTAVVNTGSGAQVWVVSDGKATPRDVEVARFREQGAVIASGLKAGEPVIITGQRALTPGLTVEPRIAQTPAEQLQTLARLRGNLYAIACER